MLRPLPIDALRQQFAEAVPFRHVVIDNFLDATFAKEVAAAFPSFGQARTVGQQFRSVNEHKKVQVTDPTHFPDPIQRLHQLLASPEFLAQVQDFTGIPDLQADPHLHGGGIHQTAPGGRLDVHVDFSYIPQLKYFRRLNILVYLNPEWQPAWGGAVELWDEQVEVCHQSMWPAMNRCLIFETNTKSYHGVTKVTCPDGVTRQSFSAYYYTYAPPPGFNDDFHGTVFRARPQERFKRLVRMPVESAMRRAAYRWRQLTGRVRAIPGTEE